METKILTGTQQDIGEAVAIIQRGGLVAFPTETVYGLGADAFNEEAVQKVFQAKGRPGDNPLIVHISRPSEIGQVTSRLSPDLVALIDQFWPGPLTLIVKKKKEVPLITTGGLDTVAVRMPDNPIALELIARSGTAIAAPSANLSGRPSPTKAQHVREDLEGRIDGILLGEDCRVGIESTVLDMSGEHPRILRPGGLLVVSACSAAIDLDSFTRALALGARDAGCQALVLERWFQGADHPVPSAFSEGLYLKSLILRIDKI